MQNGKAKITAHTCLFKWSLRMNRLSHSWQPNRFSPKQIKRNMASWNHFYLDSYRYVFSNVVVAHRCAWIVFHTITSCTQRVVRLWIEKELSDTKATFTSCTIYLCANEGALLDAKFCDTLCHSQGHGSYGYFFFAHWILQDGPVGPPDDSEDNRIESDWVWPMWTFSANCWLLTQLMQTKDSVDEIRADKDDVRERNHDRLWLVLVRDNIDQQRRAVPDDVSSMISDYSSTMNAQVRACVTKYSTPTKEHRRLADQWCLLPTESRVALVVSIGWNRKNLWCALARLVVQKRCSTPPWNVREKEWHETGNI